MKDRTMLRILLLLCIPTLFLIAPTPAARADCEPEGFKPGSRLTFIERFEPKCFCYYCCRFIQDDHYSNLVFLTLVKPEKDTRDPYPALAPFLYRPNMF